MHALLLLAALGLITALVDNGYPAIADEGAVSAQVDQLSDGRIGEPDSWRIPRPFPELDPDGEIVPLDLSEVSGDIYLPYAKHALYP
ncbi:MAG: hypothetical protein REI45_14610, partial [Propionicimonas sp.]|nr:hypothetical protein [Propionicimonas sp.]